MYQDHLLFSKQTNKKQKKNVLNSGSVENAKNKLENTVQKEVPVFAYYFSSVTVIGSRLDLSDKACLNQSHGANTLDLNVPI